MVEGLSDNENQELSLGLRRLQRLADFALKRGLRLLVDAEYTYMNDGISLLAMALMAHYNQEKALVANTYQCYLKATRQKSLR